MVKLQSRIEPDSGQRLTDLLCERPSTLCIQALLEFLQSERLFGAGCGIGGRRQAMVFGQSPSQLPEALGHYFENRTARFGWDVLFQCGNSQALLSPDITAVNIQSSLDEFEQGGFAHTIPSQQTDTFAGFDSK